MSDYHGWDSWETWNAFNWMTEGDGAQERWAARARGVEAEQFAELLRLHFESHVDRMHPEASWFSDALYRSLGRVNWRQLAEHFTGD